MISACSLFSESLQPDPEYQLTSTEQSLAQIKRWSLAARLSVRYHQTAWSGGLRWRQGPDDFVLAVNAPLGQGAMQLKGDTDGVRFRAADGSDLMADDLPQMMQHELGFDLPVVNLRYWIRGLPTATGGASIVRDSEQHIRSLRQQGWLVEYGPYQVFGDRYMPRKIRIQKDAYDIRVVVYDWLDESHDQPQAVQP